MKEKMAMISIKCHIGLLHEEDRKCLIKKISASGKNEDINDSFDHSVFLLHSDIVSGVTSEYPGISKRPPFII